MHVLCEDAGRSFLLSLAKSNVTNIRHRPKSLLRRDHTYHRLTRLLYQVDEIPQRRRRYRAANATVIVRIGYPNVANLHRRVAKGTPIAHLMIPFKDVVVSANFHRSDYSEGRGSISGPHLADHSDMERWRHSIADGGS